MNPLTRRLIHPWIWLCRFRHRCGYGVHSPFAFHLITHVIYQKSPYYQYKELREKEKQMAFEKGKGWLYEPLKVKRLLFRLVNYARPDTVVDAGRLSASSLYLRAARQKADYTGASQLSDLFLEAGVPVDFLYLHDYRRPDFVAEVLRICLLCVTDRSVFVVEGIRYSTAMYRLWRDMQQENRVVVTFDLYDLGLIFFDRKKNKQHYIVNF